MKNSHYADASGVSPANLSTASDQVILAQALMGNPVLAQIVGLKQTSLPIVGTVFNVDALLGQSGIVGVKTGWTEEAGGCFVFAADTTVDGRPTRIFGAVLGQDVLADAFNTTKALIPATASNLHVVKVAAQGAPAATVDSRWGESGDATLPKDVSFLLWPGTPVNSHVEQPQAVDAPLAKGAEVGNAVISAGNQSETMPLKTDTKISRPGLKWRLLRGP